MPSPLLFMLFAPAVGALALCLVPNNRSEWVRRIAACSTAVSLAAALIVIWRYDLSAGGYQYQLFLPWLPSLGIGFHLGVDGISATLVLLHALCAFAGVLISYAIKERVKEYYIFYLLLITGVFGVFTSLDLFFFYFFYEMAVIPMYPLIAIWGSDTKEHGVVRFSKEYASMKLTIYLTLGAVMALIGLLWLYANTGVRTFDLPTLEQHLAVSPLDPAMQRWIFPLLAFGFGVIAPLWPFHSWSPIGHAAAPSAVSMLHAAVLMKLGSYAILRLPLNLLPAGAHLWLPVIAGLCTMNIIYGGFVAMAQQDLKFIIGYSSSSHMGYVLLGLAALTPIGMDGAVLLMFAHGIMTALAFALVGYIYDQMHTRFLPELGGLAKPMPFIAACGVAAAMASSGLPGFANFVAESLVMFGAWDRYPLQAVLAIVGIAITAVYMLRFIRGIFFGPVRESASHAHDALTPFARLPYLALLAALLIVGCWPKPLLAIIDRSARPLVMKVLRASETTVAAHAAEAMGR